MRMENEVVLLSIILAIAFAFVTFDPITTKLIKANIMQLQITIVLSASAIIGTAGFVESLKKKL